MQKKIIFLLEMCISPVCNSTYEGVCDSEKRFLNNIAACLTSATAFKYWEPLKVGTYKKCHKSTGYAILVSIMFYR